MAENRKKLTQHDVSEINQMYANVTMLQATPVDIGIGFGLTEFTGSQEMTAKYYTMVRLSFEQAKRLSTSLNELLIELESSSEDHEE